MDGYVKKVLVSCVLGSVLLTGCGNGTPDESDTATAINGMETEDTEIEDTEIKDTETDSMKQEDAKYLEPEFVVEDYSYWKKELTYSEFDTKISVDGENENLHFEWAVAAGEVIIEAEELPENVQIEAIDGNVENVLLLIGEKQAYLHEVYLCDLNTNAVTEWIQGGVSQYNVYEVNVSEDLKHIVLNSDENSYYYDGKKIINLSDVCKLENMESVSASLADGNILVSARNPEDTDYTSFYVYDPESENTSFVVRLETKVNYDDRDKGFKRYQGGCATDIQESKLIVWNLVTGISYETALGETDVQDILSVDENLLLVITTDGKLNLVDKNSGETTLVSERAVDFSDAISWGISVGADGTKYLNVQKGYESFEYYKL